MKTLLVLVALAGVAHAEAAIDTNAIADDRLDTRTALGCEAMRSRTGGFLAYSNLEHQCTVVGVPGTRRDLLPTEVMAAEASCGGAWRGPACVSLEAACGRLGADTAFPRLTRVCALVAPAPAPHDPGTTEVWFGGEVGRVSEPAQLGGTETTLDLGVATHGLIGLDRFAPAVSMDFDLGSTTGGGFLYRFTAAVGVGLRIGADGQVGLTIGGGLGGITGGRLGNAWLVPVEAHALIPIGGALRVALGARGTFVFREDDRQDAAGASPFDEVDARVGVAMQRDDGLLYGVYGFGSHLRDTAIIGLALAVGRVEVITP